MLHAGARSAEAGEFTARAYLNGRLDLTQAEGVAATIAAANEQELLAARQLQSGQLARRLTAPMDSLAQTLALLEVGIDFSEEDVSFLSPAEIADRLAFINQSLANLLGESGRFESLSHEPLFVLVGRPNAGKSTLLNALAGAARAVTSPVAGTTRDVLTAEVALARGIARIADVAGIEDVAGVEDASDATRLAYGVEAEIASKMRQRALEMVEAADHVLLIRDAADPRPCPGLPKSAALTVLTKADQLPRGVPDAMAPDSVLVSAQTGQNLDGLRAALDTLAFGGPAGRPTLALNARHLESINDARAALARAAATASSASVEMTAFELREALDALGAILGQVTPDDLLGRVFSAFCIGK